MQPSGGMPYPPYGGQSGPSMVQGWAMPAPPQPRPHGAPSRSLFLIGGVGSFIAAGAAIPFSLFTLTPSFGFFFFSSLFFIGLASGVMMSIGLILHLIGVLGFWKNYGSIMGLAAFIFGLIAVGVFMSLFGFFFFGAFSPFGGPSSAFLLLVFVGFILIGVMFILDGVAFVVNRHFVQPGTSIAAGVLFIVAGGFISSILLSIVGGLTAMPALIIGGIILVSAPIPVMYAPPADYGPLGTRPPMPP